MTQPHATAPAPAALVWLDARHALIARPGSAGATVAEVDRAIDEEHQYLRRIADLAADCERVMVFGSDASRIAFEREYVALYRRPDRLIDAGIELEPAPRELADRLRFVTALAGPAS